MDGEIKYIARELRKSQTKSEKIFWQLVRNRKICNKRFLRQYIIKVKINDAERYFIADFYCPEKKLVVEIDGSIHDLHKDHDELRSTIINQQGIEVIRFRNEELSNTEIIMKKLIEYL